MSVVPRRSRGRPTGVRKLVAKKATRDTETARPSLVKKILSHSDTDTFKEACVSFRLNRTNVDPRATKSCICGKPHLVYQFYITNTQHYPNAIAPPADPNDHAEGELRIGSDCIALFPTNATLNAAMRKELKRMRIEEAKRRKKAVSDAFLVHGETSLEECAAKWTWNGTVKHGAFECPCVSRFQAADYIQLVYTADDTADKKEICLDMRCASSCVWESLMKRVREKMVESGKNILCEMCLEVRKRSEKHHSEFDGDYICAACRDTCQDGCKEKTKFWDSFSQSAWCSECYSKRDHVHACTHCNQWSVWTDAKLCKECFKLKHSCFSCQDEVVSSERCCPLCHRVCTTCHVVFDPWSKDQTVCAECQKWPKCETCTFRFPRRVNSKNHVCTRDYPTCFECEHLFDPSSVMALRRKHCKECSLVCKCYKCNKVYTRRPGGRKSKCPECDQRPCNGCAKPISSRGKYCEECKNMTPSRRKKRTMAQAIQDSKRAKPSSTTPGDESIMMDEELPTPTEKSGTKDPDSPKLKPAKESDSLKPADESDIPKCCKCSSPCASKATGQWAKRCAKHLSLYQARKMSSVPIKKRSTAEIIRDMKQAKKEAASLIAKHFES